MGFIYRDEAYFHLRQLGLEELRGDAFGRNIKEFEITEDAVLEGYDNLVARHSRIDGGGLDALFAQVSHLVLHQRDQRTDDQTQPVLGSAGT